MKFLPTFSFNIYFTALVIGLFIICICRLINLPFSFDTFIGTLAGLFSITNLAANDIPYEIKP